MKITFLGTGAADWPLERPEGTKEFRRLSSALVDDTLLIDPGPQVIAALKELRKSTDQIKYIINTHRHGDHYCSETVEELSTCGCKFIDFMAGDVKVLDGYNVRAYKANHATCTDPVHFFISDGKSTLFYGLDSAWLQLEEFRAMMEYKPDLAVLDATIGWVEGDIRIFEHNDLRMILEMKKTLDPHVKQICISHMAMTLHGSQSELETDMQPYGIVVACDGKELAF